MTATEDRLKERSSPEKACGLCPRGCKVRREAGERGYCGMDHKMYAARASLHMWEEPCISGKNGSGAVFFSGCGLRCIFCQNHEIAIGKAGMELSTDRLAEIFLELQGRGAANINLVTGAQFAPQICRALEMAREQGMDLPVVYNSGGYETVSTLRMLEGLVDIYLPDMKYRDPELARRFSRAPDYPERAETAIEEMVRQTGPCVFDGEGLLRRGTVVRHLVLPGHTRDSMDVLRFLHERWGDRIWISIMSQYTPVRELPFPELNRRVTRREYEKVLDYALSIGITRGFFQEGSSAKESFIPAFDCEGIRPPE